MDEPTTKAASTSAPSEDVAQAQQLLDGLTPSEGQESRPLADQADDYEQINDKLRGALDDARGA